MADKKERIKKQLIREVQSLAEELGRTPKKLEYDKGKNAEYRFGTWNKFLEEAGLEPLSYQNLYTKIGDNDLLEMLRVEIEKIGCTKVESYHENKSNKMPSRTYLEKRFGMTWNEILKEIGFSPNVKRFADEKLLENLKVIANKLGKTPTTLEARSEGLNISVYESKFGGFNKALELIGLEKNIEMGEVTHTDEELLEMYKSLCSELGKVATAVDIREHLKYSVSVFDLRFGGMNKLRQLAGHHIHETSVKYTKDLIVEILVREHARNNGRIAAEDVNEKSKNDTNFPSLATILRHFKTTKMSEVWEEIERDNRGLSLEDNRMELYHQGLSDTTIANIVGVRPSTISTWRRSLKLPVNKKKDNRLELYNQGLNDSAIADIVGVTHTAISTWRRNENLPINKKKRNLRDKRYELYEEGYTDKEIGKAIGVSSTAIRSWRHRENLKISDKQYMQMIDIIKNNSAKRNEESENERIKLYEEGLTDEQIAKKSDVVTGTIRLWRKRRGLPPNAKQKNSYAKRDGFPSDEELLNLPQSIAKELDEEAPSN